MQKRTEETTTMLESRIEVEEKSDMWANLVIVRAVFGFLIGNVKTGPRFGIDRDSQGYSANDRDFEFGVQFVQRL